MNYRYLIRRLSKVGSEDRLSSRSGQDNRQKSGTNNGYWSRSGIDNYAKSRSKCRSRSRIKSIL